MVGKQHRPPRPEHPEQRGWRLHRAQRPVLAGSRPSSVTRPWPGPWPRDGGVCILIPVLPQRWASPSLPLVLGEKKGRPEGVKADALRHTGASAGSPGPPGLNSGPTLASEEPGISPANLPRSREWKPANAARDADNSLGPERCHSRVQERTGSRRGPAGRAPTPRQCGLRS